MVKAKKRPFIGMPRNMKTLLFTSYQFLDVFPFLILFDQLICIVNNYLSFAAIMKSIIYNS